MNEKTIVEKNSPHKSATKKLKLKKGTGTVICIVLMIAMVTVAFILFQNVIFNGAAALADSYNAAFNSEKEATYQALYQKYFDRAEAEYHVTNRASIHIGNISEMEKLEVLKVSDVEFVVEDRKDNPDNLTSWLEVPGEGTYVVDLSAAEFIVDDERCHVSVRIPYPELTNIVIDYSNVNSLLFKNEYFDKSYKVGEDLAKKQLDEAVLLIKKEFASNERFYLNAQEAAVSSIQCLIGALNSDVENLTVDVEFY